MYETHHTFMMRMNIIDICLRIPILYMYETDTVYNCLIYFSLSDLRNTKRNVFAFQDNCFFFN